MDQTTRSLPEDGQAAGRVPGPSRQGPSSAGRPASSARMQVYRSPHEAKSISGSNSRLIKGLSARIQLHCAPTHNWESRRKDLRDSVRKFPCCALQSVPQLGRTGHVHESVILQPKKVVTGASPLRNNEVQVRKHSHSFEWHSWCMNTFDSRR